MKNGSLIHNTDDINELDKYYARPQKKKNIIIAVLVLLIFSLAAVLLYLLFSVKIKVCTTATCVRSSMEILQYIDQSADPCEDFYLFSCGNFLKNTNLEDLGSRSVSGNIQNDIQSRIKRILEEPTQDEDDPAFQQAKKFYRACMNESAVEEEGLMGVRILLEHIGGWPTLDGHRWREEKFEWEDAVQILRRQGVNPQFFFNLVVEKDRYNESRHILGLHAISYSPSQIREDAKKMYLDYMVDIAVLFGANPQVAKEDAKEVINFFLKLARLYEDSAKRNQTGLYDLYSILELQHKYVDISWEVFLYGLLHPAQYIEHHDTVVVSEPLYLFRLMELLRNEPKRLLANFIAWQTLQQFINYMPARVLDKVYKYLGNVNWKFKREPRWSTCTKATIERLDSVVSEAYIKHFFDERSRTDIEELILNIKIQFKMVLKRSSWLDEYSKELIIEHLLRNMEDVVNYNDLTNLHYENMVYEKVEILEDKLLQSVLNLNNQNIILQFEKLHKPVRENWLGKTSFVTGLYVEYSPKENILRFPVGVFGGVYYNVDRPQYMNYGALGSVAAHEMSHVFMKARDGESPGDLQSHWSMDSLVRYGEQLRCLTEQYGEFEIGELNRQFDPQKTRDEDMADLAGVKIAYHAYINWVIEHNPEPTLPALNYSPSQLFWISSAVRHCAKYSPPTIEKYLAKYQWSLPQFRVNGPLQNLEEFSNDFGCRVGSGMNPEKKCYVW